MSKSQHFQFDGGAATFIGTGILSALIVLFTIGIGYPWALCLKQKWIAKHTIIDGKRCKFTGGGGGLIGLWIKWFLLIVITCGIYSFWVIPDLQRWITERTDFE